MTRTLDLAWIDDFFSTIYPKMAKLHEDITYYLLKTLQNDKNSKIFSHMEKSDFNYNFWEDCNFQSAESSLRITRIKKAGVIMYFCFLVYVCTK